MRPTPGLQGLGQFNIDGIPGDTSCVDGKSQPYFNVEPRKDQLRSLDGGPFRFCEVYLVAERADIRIDFSRYAPGSQL